MHIHAHIQAMYEALQPLIGNHDGEQVRATLERTLRLVIPNWTADPPLCPGWYWYKPTGIAEPQLLVVDHGRIDMKLMADLGPPHHLIDVQRLQGQWAGPLLPPG